MANMKLTSVVIALMLCSVALAQQQNESSERSAPQVGMIASQDFEAPLENGEADTRPITGALPLTLGSFSTERSYVQPTFRIFEGADSNALMTAQSNVVNVTTVSGNVDLHRASRKNQLIVHYSGGGTLYPSESNLNSIFQQAGIEQLFQFRRWSLSFADDVSYTSESPFGLVQGIGPSPTTVSSSVLPNQTIFTGQMTQLSNVLVEQANYLINSRSSITVAGNFGLLRYPGEVLQESNQGGGLFGYNYSFNTRNSVGLSYGLNMFRYQGGTAGTNFDTHTFRVVYGRKVTGRLALQLSGGPQVTVPRGLPLVSPATSWAVENALRYRFRQSDLSASYSHTATAGGGILPGAETDQIQATFGTRLTRTLSGSFATGYAHNSSLLVASGTANSIFDTEFLQAALARPLGHETNVSFRYTYQHQSTNVLACSLGVCGNDMSRHLIGMGFEWHMRPLLIH